MSLVLLLKYVHVVGAIVALGANVTYAVWLRAAGRDQDRLVFAIRTIRVLDRMVANPAYIVLLLTGVGMVLLGHFSFETGWIALSLVLYVGVAVIGISLFAPAIRRQLAEAERDPTSEAYRAAATRSNVLGVLTIAIVLVIVFLMVTKPI
jgi:uncharacterized membrane protein